MKTVFSCVVDAQPKFEWQGLLWAHSLLRNTGCRPEDLRVHCMPGVTANFREAMRRLQVPVVDTQPFEGGHAFCNKIQQCFSNAFAGYDRVVLSDADIFFLAMPQFPVDAPFAGAVVRIANPPLNILRTIYDAAHVPYPREIAVSCALSPDERTFRSNLNGGFYAVAAELMPRLGVQWKQWALWLLDRIELLGSYKAHVDQVAMALALDELNLDVALLTSRFNFSINLDERRLSAILATEHIDKIDVLHYHSCALPGGDLRRTNVPLVDEAIARANKDIAVIIENNMDNLLFWNNRYSVFPELGSGVGSRGEVLQFKKRLLANVVAPFLDKDVIEVGCGDLETSRDFKFQHYLGYDLSAAALEIARKKRPDWRFQQGPLDSSKDRARADLVMCLDVLIHQKKKEDYQGLLANLVAAAGRRLIVSGYETIPQFTSNITSYHEPLSATLRSFGVFHEILEVAKYNDVSLFVADKAVTGPSLHPNDLPLESFSRMAPLIERRDVLRFVMDSSRERLGFFTQTTSRMIEYPWLLEKLRGSAPGSQILDIGSGITPLPIMLAEQGLQVSCVDSHPRTRTLKDRGHWNEWGFLDYSVFSPNLSSFHADILTFQPTRLFDAIYSISVIEHMPRSVWERTLDLLPRWLKPGGLLLLTLDLIPGTYTLWNKSEGKVVDAGGDHGLLKDITGRLEGLGFVFEELFARQNIPSSQTDVAFILGRLKPAPLRTENATVPDGLSNSHRHAAAESLPKKTGPRSGAPEKEKLYIHIGTPKTGTSSLQCYLYENYDNLMSQGVYYPSDRHTDPKQTPFFSSIYSNDKKRLIELIARMSSEIAENTRAIILSSEGFYHYTDSFTEESWRLITALANLYHTQIVVYVRPQAEFLESMYRQYLKNPKGVNAEFGSSMTIHEMLETPRLQQNLDYYASLMKWSAAVGEENILLRRYSKNILSDFAGLLKIDAGRFKQPSALNRSITREMAELLRQINPSLDNEKRNQVIRRMDLFLEQSRGPRDQTILSPAETDEIMARYRNGNNNAAKRWLGEKELFPESIVRNDSAWQPLNTDQEQARSLLKELFEIAPV